MSVDINKLRVGMKIKLSFPNAGYEPEKKQASNFVDQIFTVSDWEIHGWNTDIWVEENNLTWNSVQFEEVL
jgi:hypothetical protein